MYERERDCRIERVSDQRKRWSGSTRLFVCLPRSDLIQPGPRFPSAPLPMSDGEWFSYAMNAADDQLVERMRSLGREHASLWAEEQQEQVLQPGERPPPPPREGIAQA